MKPYLKPETYDKLKWLVQIGLPAAGTLYFALAGIWNLPSAEQVVGTIVAVDTFGGVVLQISSNRYEESGDKYDGTIHVLESVKGGDHGKFSLNLPLDAETVENADEVRLKVVPEGQV